MDLEADPGVAISVGIYALSMLIGAVSFLPGGIGGAEVSMGFMLITAGIGEQMSVVATLICRIATLWFAVLLGLLAIGYLSARGEGVSLVVPRDGTGTVVSDE